MINLTISLFLKHVVAVATDSTISSIKMESNPIQITTSSLNGDETSTKINKRLKRRRKFMIGDLSCMRAVFVPAPRIANFFILHSVAFNYIAKNLNGRFNLIRLFAYTYACHKLLHRKRNTRKSNFRMSQAYFQSIFLPSTKKSHKFSLFLSKLFTRLITIF